MDILFIYYVPSGGVETLNRQRSAALKAAGIQSHFLYYRMERTLVNDHEAPLHIKSDENEIRSLIESNRFDAIVVTSDYLLLPKIRSWGYTGKLIFEIQGLGSQETARTVLTYAISYITPSANCILSSKTPHIMQMLGELYPGFPAYFMDNCFDAERFTHRTSAASVKPIIGWIGRLEDNKNWREFLLIAHLFSNAFFLDADFYMFEDHTLSAPEERAQFDALRNMLGLESKLTVLSNIPNQEMTEYFSRMADSGGFLCSTSKVEGFGYAIVEAMSCGCPVLSTNSDGVQSSIIHNVTGKFYTLGNIHEACLEGLELIQNKETRARIQASALAHIKEHFSNQKYSQSFLEMLCSI
ncbi:glycosyltransferase family 4 protein [Metabacillus sp. FJAT-52054]|uniref:Glycosyltransferase family 4 protein n=1 Tax=Metabacillus sediminis TaxID=3117746 RepID=A0ABZ2NBV5_9BACI